MYDDIRYRPHSSSALASLGHLPPGGRFNCALRRRGGRPQGSPLRVPDLGPLLRAARVLRRKTAGHRKPVTRMRLGLTIRKPVRVVVPSGQR